MTENSDECAVSFEKEGMDMKIKISAKGPSPEETLNMFKEVNEIMDTENEKSDLNVT